VVRKSLALYYYTNGRPKEERFENHTTLWKRRPQDTDREGDFTSDEPKLLIDSSPALVITAPAMTQDLDAPPPPSIRRLIFLVIEQVTPPIILNEIKKIYRLLIHSA
jgi:hypothetical protein